MANKQINNITIPGPNGSGVTYDLISVNEGQILTDAKAYTDIEVAKLLNNSSEAVDSIMELATAMANNKSVVDALEEAIGKKANTDDLAKVATSGSYNDLSNKPTIPTGAAASKGVDTSISAASTSTNLPTSKAVADFVEGKGYKTTDNNTTYTFATGDSNGQIKVTPSGGTAQNVSVKGLGSAAYTASTAYATAAQGAKADSALQAADKTALQTAIDAKANTADLADVAISGSYNDLSNKPTIPTVNNATLTIQKNGTTVKTFTANASSNVTANITVPTKVSDLTNDAGYKTTDNNTTYTLTKSGSTITLTGSDGSTTSVTDSDTNTTYSQATSSALGLVKIGYTESGKNYPVELNSSGQMYVNVPWTDTNTDTDTVTRLRGTTSGTLVSGDITLAAGGATSISQSGNTITISSTDTNTDTKVTAVGNHYTPAEDTTAALSVDASSTTAATWNSTSLVTGVNIKRDAKGHVTGVTVDSIKMPANPNSDTNTAHSHTVGVGLVKTGDGGTTGTVDYKAKLKSETALTVDSAAATTTSGRVYPVAVDKSGYLAVNVPWTDTNSDTNTWRKVQLNGTDKLGTGTNTNPLNIKAGNNMTITESSGTFTFAATDTNTHYTTGLTAGASGTTTNAAATNPYIKVKDDSTHRAQIQLKGSGATTVSSDANGVITISSTDTNTTYSAATTSALGLVKSAANRTTSISPTTGGTTSDRYYGVELDNDGTMFVNVPWTDTDTNTDTVTRLRGTTSGTLVSGDITLAAGGATSISQSGNTITISSTDNNTDTKVTQDHSTTNANYPLLASATSGTSTSSRTTTSVFNTGVYINPSTGALTATKVYNAVFNDYAEYRLCKEDVKPGYIVTEDAEDPDHVKLCTTNKPQAQMLVVSDTYGTCMGEKEGSIPVALAGRVLIYVDGKDELKVGDYIGCNAEGKGRKMSKAEARRHPDRVVGRVSSIPNYDTWGTSNVQVDGRVWINIK